MGQADAVALVGVASEVHHAHKLILSAVAASGLGLTDVRDQVVIAIGGVNPLETCVGVIPQC